MNRAFEDRAALCYNLPPTRHKFYLNNWLHDRIMYVHVILY